MACPTCDHTMHRLCDEWFWCPRCGTIRKPGNKYGDKPRLVGRVRDMLSRIGIFKVTEIAMTTGVLESIMLPEERPKV